MLVDLWKPYLLMHHQSLVMIIKLFWHNIWCTTVSLIKTFVVWNKIAPKGSRTIRECGLVRVNEVLLESSMVFSLVLPDYFQVWFPHWLPFMIRSYKLTKTFPPQFASDHIVYHINGKHIRTTPYFI